MSTVSHYKIAKPPSIYSDRFVSNIRVTGQVDIQNAPVAPTDAANKAYVDSVAGGGGSPSNPNSSVQFNNNGVFGGSSDFTFSNSTSTLGIKNINVAEKIILNNPPIGVNDATNKAYVDSLTTPPGGLSTNIQFNQGGVFAGSSDFIWNDFTKFLYINGFITLPNAPINATDAVNKAYVDAAIGSTPGGPDTSLQYNDTGVFTGSNDLKWNNGIKVLTVNGSVTLPNAPVNATDATNKAYVDAAIGSAPGGPVQAIQFNSDPGGVFSGTNDFTWDNVNKIMSVNGDVVANRYITTSDITLKTNISHITDPIGTLNKIEGYRYNLKGASEPTFGVMAQEIEQIDGLTSIVKDLGTHKTVDYQQFIPLLIEGFKILYKENKKNLNNSDKRIDRRKRTSPCKKFI